jgi:hypothetical protein
MGFRTNKSQQMTIHDRLNNLTERERRFLDNSWAKPFGDRIFALIDESKFEVLYCNDNGRPNTPVNVVVGSLFLKEMMGLTDEELVDSIILDLRYQYALRLTSRVEIPYSDRTPSRFRERLYLHEIETGEDLIKSEIERLGGEFAKTLKIDGHLKRMDSVMISSSCRNMGRLELMYTCVSNLAGVLVKSGEGELLPERLLKYAEDSDKNAVCYRMGKDEVQTRLETVATDASLLLGLCTDAHKGYKEYQLLERMLSDQTEDGKLKPNSQISPRSLQNPSDEDATYRRKAGKGYQGYTGNFVEDCGENGNIITRYDYDVNLHADADFGAEVIEALGAQEEKTVIIADGAYASEENFDAAEENNIELVTTSLTGQEPSPIINKFHIEENVIISCPEGHAPIDCKYNEEKEIDRAHFEKDTCENCPHREECPVITRKKTALVKLSQTTINRAAYVKRLETEECKEHARKRNGVEGIPSILRRRYRVDEMPVRGLARSKMWFGFKIGAINVKRVIAFARNAFCFYFLWGFCPQKKVFTGDNFDFPFGQSIIRNCRMRKIRGFDIRIIYIY